MQYRRVLAGYCTISVFSLRHLARGIPKTSLPGAEDAHLNALIFLRCGSQMSCGLLRRRMGPSGACPPFLLAIT